MSPCSLRGHGVTGLDSRGGYGVTRLRTGVTGSRGYRVAASRGCGVAGVRIDGGHGATGSREDAPQIVNTLRRDKVRGNALSRLTYERVVGTLYNIAAGPAQNLADRINAMLAPTAATGFRQA